MYLKQHRKATLELDGRRLKGTFDVSLTNKAECAALVELISEARKQIREFEKKKK